jgi:hypothetical protein
MDEHKVKICGMFYRAKEQGGEEKVLMKRWRLDLLMGLLIVVHAPLLN